MAERAQHTATPQNTRRRQKTSTLRTRHPKLTTFAPKTELKQIEKHIAYSTDDNNHGYLQWKLKKNRWTL